MIPFWRSWFLTRPFFLAVFGLALPAVLSVWLTWLYVVTLICLALLLVAVAFDTLWLWRRNCRVGARREMDTHLNNGEWNSITLVLHSTYPAKVQVVVVDELPLQLQERDFSLTMSLESNRPHQHGYTIRPVERGEYAFGSINIFVRGPMHLVQRRYSWEANRVAKVYPSVPELKRAEMHAFSQKLSRWGMRKQRRVGHTMEFEKIKEYVAGDDVRTINWKATARTSNLMINQYQEQRSQDIVAVIDTGRVMQAPFNGMSSLNYAVNATLAFSNVVLRKHDHAGLITYGGNTSNIVAPNGSAKQLLHINEWLYNLDTDFHESNDELLLLTVRKSLRTRSLLILYTNIEALSTLKRRLPIFKLLAQRHVVAIVIFANTEVHSLADMPISTTEDVYSQMVVRDYIQQKNDIVIELRHHGIYCVVAPPEKLSIASIDIYLDLKSRGII